MELRPSVEQRVDRVLCRLRRDVLIAGITESSDVGRPESAVENEAGVPPVSFFHLIGASSSFTFAYQGHSRFLEISGNMVDQTAGFPKALLITYPLMTSLYAVTIVFGYGFVGKDVSGFLPSALSPGAVKDVVGALLVFHILVAYTFLSNVFVKNLHFLVPFSKTEIYDEEGSPRAHAHWALLSLGYLTLTYVLANVIPFFAALQEVVGALSGGPIIFFFPCAFYLRAYHLHSKPVPYLDLSPSKRSSLWIRSPSAERSAPERCGAS